MELGTVAASAVAKLFIMVLVGVAASVFKVIDEKGTAVLSKTVTRVINPCQLFCSYCIAFEKAKLKSLLLAAGLTFGSIGLCILLSVLFIRKRSDSWRVDRVSMALYNCGFMGIPLITAMFGSEYVFYLTGCIMAFNVMSWTYGAMTLSGETNLAAGLKRLLSPCIVAIVLGFAVFCTGLGTKIPQIVCSGLKSVGDCTTPVSMLVAGSTIARAKFSDTLTNKQSWLVVFTRLILSPLLVIIILQFFTVPTEVYSVVVTSAACPVAVVVVSQAVEFKRQPGYAGSLFALTTTLCIATIPLIWWAESYISAFFN